MQGILKNILALTKSSEVVQWQAAESALIQQNERFDPSVISRIAVHFAESQQGSEEFWKYIDNGTVLNLDNFTGDELINISHAFMMTDYEVSDALDEKLGEGLDQWFENEINEKKQKNPFHIADEIQNIQSILQFKGGPGYNTRYKSNDIDHGAVRFGVTENSQPEQDIEYNKEEKQLIEEVEKISLQINQNDRISFKDLLGIK